MKFGGQPSSLLQWESTPMSDIIFNLLLFFLLTASFATETGLDLSLPKAVEPTTVTSQPVWAKARFARSVMVLTTFGLVSTNASVPPAMTGLVAILWITGLPKK